MTYYDKDNLWGGESQLDDERGVIYKHMRKQCFI